VDVILRPGLQPGAVSVFLDFISYRCAAQLALTAALLLLLDLCVAGCQREQRRGVGRCGSVMGVARSP
jgi:hypothetical protein